ncbi:hypothetical protein NKI34_35440, partial [Mesorhizobium sp. M0700]|uniref:hypothetical protein n=1 Tax=Mesorhizobium sp. M0700 TaxID=2956988 RepID=UPI0033379E70
IKMAAFEHDKLPEKRAAVMQQMTFLKSFATEPSIAVPVCLCPAANCRKTAGGFSTLPSDHPMLSAGFYAPYLQRNSGPFPRGIGMFAKLVGS